MITLRRLGLRPIAACGLLLLLGGTGCKKYTTGSIDFKSWGFHSEHLDMMRSETRIVNYPIQSGDGPPTIDTVRIQCSEPSIKMSYTQKDTDGATLVRVAYQTSNTPPGTFPVRITFVSKDGSFIERVTTIKVVSFLALMSDSAARYYVIDTIDEAPFVPYGSTANYNYYTKIRHVPGTPANRFYFSSLGYYKYIDTFDDVYVDIDTLTGEIVAPPQNPGSSSYRGSGYIVQFDGYYGLKGFYTYTYRSSSGTLYEGHLSF
jgi:hypothetical protein